MVLASRQPVSSSPFNLYRHLLLTPLYAHVGPLDPVTCEEAELFTVYTGPLNPPVGVTPLYLLTCKKAVSLGYRGPLDPQKDLTPQKVRVAKKVHEKSNILIL